MVDAVAKAPWTLHRHARELASLHQQLHALEAPAFLRDAQVRHGNAIVHMDLHPLNVLIGARGPIVIDWTGAARGDSAADLCIAWVLMATGQVRASGLEAKRITLGRNQLVRSFLSRFDRRAVATGLREVVAYKVRDPHMSESEVSAMWQLAERYGR